MSQGQFHQHSLTTQLERFEREWQTSAKPPDIQSILDQISSDEHLRRDALNELVMVDLEYRWKSTSTPNSISGDAIRPRMLEEYVERYPELGDSNELPVELICQEYRVRCHFGDRPGHSSYLKRFSSHGDELRRRLAQVDQDWPKSLPNDRIRRGDLGHVVGQFDWSLQVVAANR